LKPISDQIAELKKVGFTQRPIILPNIPKDDVPNGPDESANVVIKEVGKKRTIKNPRDYMDLAEPLNLIDTKRAGKVSGTRFGYLLGPVAQLEFALIQYAQAKLIPAGFTLVIPPVLIKEENMAAMGYLDGGGEDETYHFIKDKLYLVGTSEQSMGPLHRDEILPAAELPKRYMSFSTCFRREAGSYGKDTRGILRVHQFDKLEMFVITTPDNSDAEQKNMLGLAEKLWQGLEIPYRVVNLCTGDLSWPSARTYDIEAWMPGQNQYREVGSTSTTTDYQSRALNIKYQRGHEKGYVHLLNGTIFSGRPIIAILENYQREDGTIDVPKVLQPYMHGLKRIGA
jgi:seryl-tRNA synthetase